MSDKAKTANVEVTLEVRNNSEVEMAGIVDGYAADQARAYKDEAGLYAADALNSKNMAEAWAASDGAPAGKGSRSSKTWADTARQWAESEGAPDGISEARSAKSWCQTAQAWAESAEEPDEIRGSHSAKTWAEEARVSAGKAFESASASQISAKASADSAEAAGKENSAAQNAATLAKQSADAAREKLAQMQADLNLKANVNNAVLTGTPSAPTPTGTAQETQITNVAYVKQKIAELVNGSEASLDTLKELANALGNNPHFATTVMEAIGKKLDATATAQAAIKDEVGNNIKETYATKAELSGQAGVLSVVATTGSYSDLLDKPAIPSATSQIENDSRFVSTDSDGNLVLSGTITAAKVYNAVYNDYAEFFPRGGDSQRGDIIALDESVSYERYVRATENSRCVVGVHTEEFAQIIGGKSLEPSDDILKENLPNYIPIALAGRVHVRMYGKAEKGGWVIPSEMPGVGRMAMDGEDISQSVGQIVKADAAQNVRLVKILVRSGR